LQSPRHQWFINPAIDDDDDDHDDDTENGRSHVRCHSTFSSPHVNASQGIAWIFGAPGTVLP